jgi:hypothetical protein
VGYNKSHPFYRKKTMNFEEKTKNQGTSKPEASHSENGDMAWACCEELVELDDVQLATVVGGVEEGGVVTPFAWGGPPPPQQLWCPIGYIQWRGRCLPVAQQA